MVAETTPPTGETQAKNTAIASVPPVPRMTGDAKRDNLALIHWAQALYNSLERSNIYLKTAEQFTDEAFNAADLPDPGAATVSSAQRTANEAYILATRQSRLILQGSITVEGADRTATHTFEEPLDSADYVVMVTPHQVTGAAPLEATKIIQTIKTKNDFTITVNTAPGGTNTVEFDWLLRAKE